MTIYLVSNILCFTREEAEWRARQKRHHAFFKFPFLSWSDNSVKSLNILLKFLRKCLLMISAF